MIIKPIDDYKGFKDKFRHNFYNVLDLNSELKNFFYNAFLDGTAYVVGGFLRDLANDRTPRDLDIILTISPDTISTLLSNTHLDYKINRMGGAKIILDNFEIDIWSIENNWGFKTGLIKKNEQYIVDNIASGCFFNFDSLVINVHKSMELSTKNYNYAAKMKKLDILYKGQEYQKNNPTIEANILKAFYIKRNFEFKFSYSCQNYIVQRLLYLHDKYGSSYSRLIEIKKLYPKYDNVLSDDNIVSLISDLLQSNNTPSLFNPQFQENLFV